jgi:hypothetical protein
MATTYNLNQNLYEPSAKADLQPLKTIYITRNIRLQNFQGGGNPNLSHPATLTFNNLPPAPRSNLHPNQPAP